MRITPLDIKKRVFNKAFRGYNIEEVEEFIDRIAAEYERLYTDHRKFTKEIAKLEEEVKEFSQMEKSLKQALLSAQKTSSSLTTNAEREAQIIIKEAELNAEKIVDEAKSEAKDLLKHIKVLNQKKKMIKLDLKSLLESYMESLDLNEGEVQKVEKKQPLIKRKKNESKSDQGKQG